MSDYLWYIHYLCVYALQARNLKEERGITLALWKSFYVMLERIVEIYIIYIEEWNMSNCIKEQKICQIFCTYYLLSDWSIHLLMEFLCILRFIFMFEKKISLTSLFESEFDFQSRVLHHKFLTREHFNTKSHYSIKSWWCFIANFMKKYNF